MKKGNLLLSGSIYIHITMIIIFIVAAIVPGALIAENLYLNVPWLRLGIDRSTALPAYFGIGPRESGWIDKNLMPADTIGLLESPDGCSLLSLTVDGNSSISSTWKVGENGVPVKLVYEAEGDEIHIRFSRGRDGNPPVKVIMRIPFNPFVTSTTFLSSNRDEEGMFYLPGVLSAPDHGQLQVTPLNSSGEKVRVRLVGSRKDHRLSLLLYFDIKKREQTGMAISKYSIPGIPGASVEHREIVQHAWFNIFTTRAENDTTIIKESFPLRYKIPQLVANNSLSDPVPLTYFNVSDMAFLTKDTPVLSLRLLIRNTISWWLDNKVTDRGAAYDRKNTLIFSIQTPLF